MNIDFSGLLKLFHELSNSSFCFILRAEDDGLILSSNDTLAIEVTELIKEFRAELNDNFGVVNDISELASIHKLKHYFKAESIFLTPLTEIDCSYSYLVDINNNHDNPIESNPHLNTIINSIKSELKMDYELNEKLELTLSKIDAVVYSYNIKKKRYDFISTSVQNILGLTSQEIRENQFRMVRRIKKSHLKDFKLFTTKVKHGESSSFDYEYKINSNKYRLLHHVAEPIVVNGKIKKVVGVITDITREKDIFNKLKKSERRFGLLINTAMDFIYSLNGFGYLVHVNENGANTLGYTAEEMLGKHFLDFATNYQKDELTKSFQNMLASKSTIHFEIDLLHKLDKSIKYEFLATPFLEDGEITGMLGIGRDITRRRKNEGIISSLRQKLKEKERLVEIERDRAKQQITILEEINLLKNEFISNVSHELRTPLASIVGFAETLTSDEYLPRDLINEFSNIILTESKRLAIFIDDILDFSELEGGATNLQKEEFNIIELLNTIAKKNENAFSEKNISFTSLIPDAEITIFADRGKLEKAFNTILENTLRFTTNGDKVSFVIQEFLKEVEITISDNGNGISENDIKFLFDKFHSAGSTNAVTPTAGIALSLVKQIFEHHKGLLQVKSSLGEGTTFIIRLPKAIN